MLRAILDNAIIATYDGNLYDYDNHNSENTAVDMADLRRLTNQQPCDNWYHNGHNHVTIISVHITTNSLCSSSRSHVGINTAQDTIRAA